MERRLTHAEANQLEDVVRDLILKGKHKRAPFTPQDLDNAVAHGVGLINHILKLHYPNDEEVSANRKIDELEGFLQRSITSKW